MTSDRVLGGVLLLLALAYIVGATQIEAAFTFDALGPKAFPIIIGGVLGISALFLLIRPDPEPDWPSGRAGLEIVAAFVVLVAYAFLLPALGFVISTAIVSAILSWRLGASLVMAGPIGIGISLGIYVVFRLILGLSLARGPFGF